LISFFLSGLAGTTEKLGIVLSAVENPCSAFVLQPMYNLIITSVDLSPKGEEARIGSHVFVVFPFSEI